MPFFGLLSMRRPRILAIGNILLLGFCNKIIFTHNVINRQLFFLAAESCYNKQNYTWFGRLLSTVRLVSYCALKEKIIPTVSNLLYLSPQSPHKLFSRSRPAAPACRKGPRRSGKNWIFLGLRAAAFQNVPEQDPRRCGKTITQCIGEN